MPATATHNSFVRARVNDALRDDAAAVLADLGLTISDVMRMTLTRIARERRCLSSCSPQIAPPGQRCSAQEIMAARQHRFATGKDLLNGLERQRRRQPLKSAPRCL